MLDLLCLRPLGEFFALEPFAVGFGEALSTTDEENVFDLLSDTDSCRNQPPVFRFFASDLFFWVDWLASGSRVNDLEPRPAG